MAVLFAPVNVCKERSINKPSNEMNHSFSCLVKEVKADSSVSLITTIFLNLLTV